MICTAGSPPPTQEHLWQCLETLMIATTGVQWLETRDIAKHPIINRTFPTTKNYSPPNVHNTEVVKLP